MNNQDLVKVLETPLKLNAKSGEQIYIITDTAMEPEVWQALSQAAVNLSMEPTVAIMQPRAFHAQDPIPSIVSGALDPSNDLVVYLTSTALAHAPITDLMIEHERRFLLMEEVTTAILDKDGPAGADYHALNILGRKIADLFTNGKQVTVTCPNGTHLTASIEGRVGRAITGLPVVMRPGGGSGCAFPDGETHVCPVEGTGEGTIVFDMTAHSVGALAEPITVTVKNGMAVSIEGGKQAAMWREIFAKHGDPESFNCPAEIAIGLNPQVKQTGSMRTDKKMYATSHIGLGDTTALGGTCKAKLRLEGVIREPCISVDGVVVTRGGKILID